MLHGILEHTGQPPPQRITQLQMSVVPRFRNTGLKLTDEAYDTSVPGNPQPQMQCTYP